MNLLKLIKSNTMNTSLQFQMISISHIVIGTIDIQSKASNHFIGDQVDHGQIIHFRI